MLLSPKPLLTPSDSNNCCGPHCSPYYDKLRELVLIIEEGLPPMHLNAPNTPFVGRDQLITEIITSLTRLPV
jgi:hypothetical protein